MDIPPHAPLTTSRLSFSKEQQHSTMMPNKAEITSDFLELDQQTLIDLEIFASKGEQSLFQFCDLTHTKGAKKALRQRMEKPPVNAERIRDVQLSLAFIIDTRDVFNRLPNSYIISRVEHYRNVALPVVVSQNLVEFAFTALSMWANNYHHVFRFCRT